MNPAGESAKAQGKKFGLEQQASNISVPVTFWFQEGFCLSLCTPHEQTASTNSQMFTVTCGKANSSARNAFQLAGLLDALWAGYLSHCCDLLPDGRRLGDKGLVLACS